ncbi:MAG: redoxin domain-containing protein [Spirulinaceae cyanobacterium SM2_1_0]|nr:redoxin domain-containing protein [Spirulinaceae cyanobacterium SM2_1_0]
MKRRLASLDLRSLLTARFFSNFLPLPARSIWRLGHPLPDFVLPDVRNRTTARLSDYRGRRTVVLAFTRIFSEKHYCPLCYPHIVALNEAYPQFVAHRAEVLLVTSTDTRQSARIVQDLDLQMPLLSNPSCDTFRTYQLGQALGAPLPAQFVIDNQGRLQFKHLFSFLDANASVEQLLAIATAQTPPLGTAVAAP